MNDSFPAEQSQTSGEKVGEHPADLGCVYAGATVVCVVWWCWCWAGKLTLVVVVLSLVCLVYVEGRRKGVERGTGGKEVEGKGKEEGGSAKYNLEDDRLSFHHSVYTLKFWEDRTDSQYVDVSSTSSLTSGIVNGRDDTS